MKGWAKAAPRSCAARLISRFLIHHLGEWCIGHEAGDGKGQSSQDLPPTRDDETTSELPQRIRCDNHVGISRPTTIR